MACRQAALRAAIGGTHMTRQRLSTVALATSLALAGCGAAATPSSPPIAATPAPPAATASTAPAATSQPTMQLMGRGQFHDVDGMASGEAQLIVAPDGTYEVALESFSIATIEHTNVVLVKNA